MARGRRLGWTIPLCLLSTAGRADEARDRVRALYDGRPSVLEFTARVGSGSFEVPAARFPCRNCHSRDGRGGREAGIVAPAIDPVALSRPSPKRPPYDATHFAAAVRDGRDSAGRTLDPSMPRYALDDAALADLWASLAAREAEETRGIDAGSVRFGIVSRAGLDLAALMRTAWRERGEPVIHGRRILFESVEPIGRDGVLASLFDQAAPASDTPRLFPFSSWSDRDRPDDVRGLFADQRRQAGALVERLPPDARRIAERARSLDLADPSDQRVSWEDLDDVVAIDGPALVLATPSGWSALCRRVKRGAHLYAPLHDIEPFVPCLREAGATVTLADPSFHPSESPQHPFPVRLVRTAAAILEDALVQAGRDLTRGSAMRAVGVIRRDDLPWPSLDFVRHPLSGSRSVEIRTVK